MSKPMQVSLLGLVLAAAIVSVMVPARAAAASRNQSSLQIHKWKFHMDDKAAVWLQVQFANKGNRPVRVLGVAPTRFGPWSDVGQTVAPDAMVKTELKTDKGAPSVVWLDTSEGLCVFDLPKRP